MMAHTCPTGLGPALLTAGAFMLNAFHAAAAPVRGEFMLTLANGGRYLEIVETDLTIKVKCYDASCDSLVTGTLVMGGDMALFRLASAAATGDKLTFVLTSVAGQDQYQIEVARSADSLSGTYTGTVAGTQVSGSAHGTLVALPPGYVPPTAGEHPRLLLTKAGLEQLKQRVASGDGARLFAALKSAADPFNQYHHPNARNYEDGSFAAGQALLHALTGETKYLKGTQTWLVKALGTRNGEYGAYANARRVLGAVIAYDFAGYALDEEFRRQVFTTIRPWVWPNRRGASNSQPTSNVGHLGASFKSAGGMAGLLFKDEPVEMRRKPVQPSSAPIIAPDNSPVPVGVPVSGFKDGVVQPEYLGLGPLALGVDEDPLASAGGLGAARPTPGQSLNYEDAAETWTPFTTSPQAYGNHWMNLPGAMPPPQMIGLYKATGGTAEYRDRHKDEILWRLCYAVVDNDQPRAMIAKPNLDGHHLGVSMWIAGKRVHDGQVYRLEKGRYPIMIKLPLIGLWAGPCIAEYDDTKYQSDIDAWTEDSAAAALNGDRDPFFEHRYSGWVELIRGHLREAYGPGGFTTENVGSGETWRDVAPYLYATTRVLGRPVWEGTGAGVGMTIPVAMLTRQRHANWLSADGGLWAGWLTYGFPGMVAPEYLGALRWHIDNAAIGRMFGIEAVFALINYPYDVPAVDQKSAGLPLYHYDAKWENVVFRGGWDDSKDVTTIFTVYNNAYSAMTATDFTIFYRGGDKHGKWAGYMYNPVGVYHTPKDPGNVLRIDGALPYRGAKTTYRAHAKDGSGIVSCVVDHYAAGDYGGIFDNTPKWSSTDNLGIRTMRAFAVDYSGKSGTPALYAVVDTVSPHPGRGVGFTMYFGKGRNATASGASFSVTGGDGTLLSGKVLAPANAQLASEESGARLTVTGGDRYFVVFTLGEGAGPAITTSGSGLDAVAKVGEQEVSFDRGEGRIALKQFVPEDEVNAAGSPRPAVRHSHWDGSMVVTLYDLAGRRVHQCVSSALPMDAERARRLPAGTFVERVTVNGTPIKQRSFVVAK